MDTVAEGWWCTTCETFESEDETNTTVDVCISCGDAGEAHVPVEIVTKVVL